MKTVKALITSTLWEKANAKRESLGMSWVGLIRMLITEWVNS